MQHSPYVENPVTATSLPKLPPCKRTPSTEVWYEATRVYYRHRPNDAMFRKMALKDPVAGGSILGNWNQDKHFHPEDAFDFGYRTGLVIKRAFPPSSSSLRKKVAKTRQISVYYNAWIIWFVPQLPQTRERAMMKEDVELCKAVANWAQALALKDESFERVHFHTAEGRYCPHLMESTLSLDPCRSEVQVPGLQCSGLLSVLLARDKKTRKEEGRKPPSQDPEAARARPYGGRKRNPSSGQGGRRRSRTQVPPDLASLLSQWE